MPSRAQWMCAPLRCVFHDRLVGMLLARGNHAEDGQRGERAGIGLEHLAGRHAVDPHHGGGGVAHHAARAAGIAGCHDGRQETDVHLALVQHRSHGAADHGRSDVVEEAGDEEHQDQHHEAALPVIRQVLGQDGGDARLLEVVGQQREAEQQAEQVGNGHPLVAQKAHQPRHTGHAREVRQQQLVQRDDDQARHRHLERVVMKQRHAEQRQCKEEKINRDACDDHGCLQSVSCRKSDRSAGPRRCRIMRCRLISNTCRVIAKIAADLRWRRRWPPRRCPEQTRADQRGRRFVDLERMLQSDGRVGEYKNDAKRCEHSVTPGYSGSVRRRMPARIMSGARSRTPAADRPGTSRRRTCPCPACRTAWPPAGRCSAPS